MSETYGIFRQIKVGRPGVFGCQVEANRSPDDQEKRDFAKSNINWDRTNQNVYLKKSEHWNQSITTLIKEKEAKERKDSIVMLEAMFTASPEYFEKSSKEDIEQYFQDCYDFYKSHYCAGDDNRIFNAVIHYDETTPHMHISAVPILENEKGFSLCAKKIVGNRSDLREAQDKFYEEVCQSRGFDRGHKVAWDKPFEERVHHKDTYDFLLEQVQKLEKDVNKKEDYIKKLESRIDELDSNRRNVIRKYNQKVEEYNALVSDIKGLRTEFEKLSNSPQLQHMAAKQFIKDEGLYNKFMDFMYKYKNLKLWKPKNFTETKTKAKEFER